MTGTFQELPITDIYESPLLTNPRATYDQDALDELGFQGTTIVEQLAGARTDHAEHPGAPVLAHVA